MRSLAIMRDKCRYPIIFDATNSVQQLGSAGRSSGGDGRTDSVLARASVAVGVAALFIEVPQDPDNAPSDGPDMINLSDLRSILKPIKKLDQLTKAQLR